jgi:hypothetical protein
MTHKLTFALDETGHGKVQLDGRDIAATEIIYHAGGGAGIAEITLKIMAEVDGEVEIKELTNVTPKKPKEPPPPADELGTSMHGGWSRN